MLARTPDRMSEQDYLRWEAAQDDRWELVDGRVLNRAERKGWTGPKAMAGGRRRHAHICQRLIRALGDALGDGPCQPTTSDIRVRTAEGAYRFPDVVVDCGEIGDQLVCDDPGVVVEVLSPSNTLPEQLRLLEDYQSIDSVQQVVFILPDEPLAVSWDRAGAFWPRRQVSGVDAQLDFPSLAIAAPLAKIYAGLSFPGEATAP